mgnify:CR=1 FL=1
MSVRQKSKSPGATGPSAIKSYLLHCPITMAKEQCTYATAQMQLSNCNTRNRPSLLEATALPINIQTES